MSKFTENEPIKIVRIMDRLNVGGPAIHAILLSRHKLWQTTLIYGQEGPTEGDMLHLAREAGIEPLYLPSLGRELHPLRDFYSFWKLVQIIRKEHPHIVHTHKSKAGVVGRLAAYWCRVPVIIHTYHGHVLHGYFGAFKSRVFTTIEKWLSSWTDALIAVSPKVRDDLLKAGIARPEKIQVIYLGLDLKKFAERNRHPGRLHQELGLPVDTPLVGIVARLVPIKNILLFLQAAASLRARHKNVQYVIVGDGELRASLEHSAESLGIRPQVHFLGFRKDVENIYPDLDILTLTSSNEGSPVSLIEGLAAGCPVVAVNVGGVSDVVRDNNTGLLVDPNQKSPQRMAEELADVMSQLLQDPARQKRLGENGRADVLQRFAIERLVADLTDLYRQCMSQKVL